MDRAAAHMAHEPADDGAVAAAPDPENRDLFFVHYLHAGCIQALGVRHAHPARFFPLKKLISNPICFVNHIIYPTIFRQNNL